MRRILVLVCLIVTVVLNNCPSIVMAAENSTEEIADGVKISYKYEELSYEQAVIRVMEKENLKQVDAESLLGVSYGNGPRKAQSFPTYTKTYTFPGGYEIEIGGMWEVYNSGSFRQFERLVDKWTGATGSGNYTWNQFHISDTTSSYPTIKVSLAARGTITIAVNTSTTAGVNLGNQLSNVGFTISTSSGTTTYYRLTKNLALSKSLY